MKLKTKKVSSMFFLGFLINFQLAQAQVGEKNGNWKSLKLNYDKPTDQKDFEATIPLGNGRLTAKFYGRVASEIINLNEVAK